MRDYYGTSGVKHAPTNRKAPQQKKPGRIVGVIAVAAKHKKHKDFNPLQLFWAVDKDRKDYFTVVEQIDRRGSLPKYEQQLFDSCFKNWGATV